MSSTAVPPEPVPPDSMRTDSVPTEPLPPDLASPGPVRLGTSAEIVDALPYLVGFFPADSLVLVSLRGPRGRVGLTARVDLPPPEWAEECARQLVPYLERDGARRAVVATYPPTDGPAHPSVRALADAFPDRLSRAGIALADLLCVHDDRWWSLTCDDPRCCPPGGTPVRRGSVSVLGAAMAVRGRRVLPSREALAATLAPPGGARGTAMARMLRRAEGRLADLVWRGRRDEVEAESRRLFHDAVRRRSSGRELDDAEAARLIVALDDVPVRDEVLGWVDGERGEATRALLTDLVQRATDPFRVAPLTVLAWLAFQQGDGTLARLAVDRALAADPAYGLARILGDALASGADPAVFRSVLLDRADPAREPGP